MTISPVGANLSIGGNVVIVESISYSTVFEPFERLEYDNTKQREAKTDCGEHRLLGEVLSGKPFQIVYSCSDDTPVPLWPNTETDFQNINKRFDIRRYQITGTVSEGFAVDGIYAIADSHQALIAKFERYKKRASGDISYADLYALRSETFDYLINTGIELSGTAIDTTESDILITNFSAEISLAIPLDENYGFFEFYKSFTLTAEVRSITELDGI